MIAEEPRIVDIDPAHWANLIALIAEKEPAPPGKAATFALVLTRGGQAVKAIHGTRGVVRGYRLPASGKLKEVAADLGADRVAMCDVDAFARIFDAGQRAFAWDDDWDKQVIDMLNAGAAAEREAVQWYPKPPFRLRRLNHARLRKWFERLWPDGRTAAFVVFDEGRVFTSLILGKEEGRVALLTTLAGVDTAGFAPARWRKDARLLVSRIGKAHGKPFVGLFLARRTFQEMRAGRLPLRYLLEARRRGTAVIAPFPFRLRVLLRLAAALRIA